MTSDQVTVIRSEPRCLSGLRSLFQGGADWSLPYVQFAGYLLVVIQCAAVLLLVHRFRLENELFQQVVTIAMAGFLIHHWLPARLRLPFFVAISLGAVAYFFGFDHSQWRPLLSLKRTATLLAVGGALIALCHLPGRYSLRISILLAAAGALAFFRAGFLHFGPLDAIWPVLGAMFMFRLFIYAYDIEHDEQRPSIFETLAYFFLFPAVWLFVFPVIDLRTFRSTYFNDRPLIIYNKGVQWMFRGIVQLLLWRLVYYHAYLDPSLVASGTDLMQYLVSNVALYLRVSGQFHFVIGLLHLFGFHLPETHRRYFLASSFTDYWRRINIYWKDFITRLVYYPLVLRLKTWPAPRKVMLATAAAFLVTWFLHGYQWFWLRGSFPVEPKDALFWGAFGLVVLLNSVRELSKGRRRSLTRPVATWRDNVKLGLRTSGTFLALLALWSIWSCDTVTQCVDIWKLADRFTLMYSLLLAMIIAAAAIVIEGPARPWAVRSQAANPAEGNPFPWRYTLLTCLIPAASLYFLSSYRIRRAYPEKIGELVESLSDTSLNKNDQDYLVRGYYENLMDGSRFNNLLNNAFIAKPVEWARLDETEAARSVADMRVYELIPSKVIVFNGKTLTINRWGMRDKDYALAKESGVLRIAVLGASHEMGYGIDDHETFETLLETRLNASQSGQSWQRFEILNFSAGAYTPLSRVEVLHKKVIAFHPDVLLYFSHHEESGVTIRQLAQALREGATPQYDFVREVVRKTGIDATTPRSRIERRLAEYRAPLVNWAYHEIAAVSRANGIDPVWVLAPSTQHFGVSDESRHLTRFAEQAGFQILNLAGTFAGMNLDTLIVAPWDRHYNAAAHELIADALYREIFRINLLKGGVPAHRVNGGRF